MSRLFLSEILRTETAGQVLAGQGRARRPGHAVRHRGSGGRDGECEPNAFSPNAFSPNAFSPNVFS
eukprot:COSAG01_NODE_13587_length_1563_cov_1.796448_3_plen_65_part_01